MSGIETRARPPNIEKLLKHKLFNPHTDFPEDLRDKLFLCDEFAPKPEEYEKELEAVPIDKAFPQFDPPYKLFNHENEYYHDKDDKKALNDPRVSDIAKIGELGKRKKRMKELLRIYDAAKEKFNEEKAKNSRSQKSSTKEIQQILDSSKNTFGSTDDDNSNESSSVENNDSSDDSDSEHYESYDEEVPRERKRKYQEKPRSSRAKSDKRDDNSDSPKKKSRQIHEPDKEKNYKRVISGKVTALPFVDEVYNQQKYLLDKLKQMNSNNQSEETLKKIKEQEEKVEIVHKILKDLSTMPESPSMVPTNNIKPEKMREHDIYQRKLDLAHKEIEKENSMSIHQDKIESASSRANAIDESMKDIFGSSDDSNSSDSDGNLLNEI